VITVAGTAKKTSATVAKKAAATPALLSGGNPQIAKGDGWFLNFHCFTKYIKVAFFRGTSLRPVPPGESKHKEVRYLDIHEHNRLDDAQFTAWVKQASQLPGERM
jgi:hypothetical protein